MVGDQGLLAKLHLEPPIHRRDGGEPGVQLDGQALRKAIGDRGHAAHHPTLGGPGAGERPGRNLALSLNLREPLRPRQVGVEAELSQQRVDVTFGVPHPAGAQIDGPTVDHGA